MADFPHKANYKYYDYKGRLCEVYYTKKDIGFGYPEGTIYILRVVESSDLPLLERG